MTFRRNRRRDERGFVAVMFTLMLVVFLGLSALLVDVGQLRVSTRDEQLYVDLAALAAGNQLTAGSPVKACQDAITYLDINDHHLPSAINASSFCSALSNSCTNTSTEATPSTTLGNVTVSVHFPVPASEIQSSYWTGAGTNDGPTQCQRMRVLVTTRDTSLFGRIFGVSSSTTTRSATVRPYPLGGKPPALWLLDPTGCVSLNVNGGSQVTVGTSTVPGIITVDSNGTTCTGGNATISASGAGTTLQAVGPPSGGTTGQINLVALPAGTTTCAIPACSSSDVTNGRLAPQPIHGNLASRQYVDWVYNCKTGYPTYHGITINDCPYTAANGGASYPYIDNLKTAVGASGKPSGFTQIGPAKSQCSPSASVTYPVGNYWVDCTRSNNGFVVNGGVTVTFAGGNLVFEDSVTVSTGGTLNLNTNNTTAALSTSCTPPTVQTPCLTGSGSSSTNAAIVYFRGDSGTQFSTSGTGIVNANHVFVYGGTGSIAFSGNPPTWTDPTEGPFAGLAYWTDMPSTATNAQLSSFTITGGSGANLTGVFFTPEAAPFKLAGGGNWGQQHAQFISYQLTVTGGGVLTMAPDSTAVAPPLPKGLLIR